MKIVRLALIYKSHISIAKKHFKPDYMIIDPGRVIKDINGNILESEILDI